MCLWIMKHLAPAKVMHGPLDKEHNNNDKDLTQKHMLNGRQTIHISFT